MSFVESTAVLRLTDIAVEDSGEYMCEAQNEAGSDHCSSILIVKYLFIFFLSLLLVGRVFS